jgi:uncharacterized linocin/CFP29 family protein
MSEKYLQRSDAPFDPKVWDQLDRTIVGTAKSRLTARKLLNVDGPYGIGLKMVPTEDVPLTENMSLVASGNIPLVNIQSEFNLAIRDIAAFEQRNIPLPLVPVVESALEVADLEDDILLNGSKHVGAPGLMTAPSISSYKLGDWSQLGSPVEDIIKAVTILDDSGFHGPYSLALSPQLYNLLYRHYAQSELTQLEHAGQIVTDGIIKSSAIKDGGVLIASGAWFANIVIGQDMMAGFIGPELGSYKFSLTESIALRIVEPHAICSLAH